MITQGHHSEGVGVVFSFKINISCVSYSIIKCLKGVILLLQDLFTLYFSDDYSSRDNIQLENVPKYDEFAAVRLLTW